MRSFKASNLLAPLCQILAGLAFALIGTMARAQIEQKLPLEPPKEMSQLAQKFWLTLVSGRPQWSNWAELSRGQLEVGSPENEAYHEFRKHYSKYHDRITSRETYFNNSQTVSQIEEALSDPLIERVLKDLTPPGLALLRSFMALDSRSKGASTMSVHVAERLAQEEMKKKYRTLSLDQMTPDQKQEFHRLVWRFRQQESLSSKKMTKEDFERWKSSTRKKAIENFDLIERRLLIESLKDPSLRAEGTYTHIKMGPNSPTHHVVSDGPWNEISEGDVIRGKNLSVIEIEMLKAKGIIEEDDVFAIYRYDYFVRLGTDILSIDRSYLYRSRMKANSLDFSRLESDQKKYLKYYFIELWAEYIIFNTDMALDTTTWQGSSEATKAHFKNRIENYFFRPYQADGMKSFIISNLDPYFMTFTDNFLFYSLLGMHPLEDLIRIDEESKNSNLPKLPIARGSGPSVKMKNKSSLLSLNVSDQVGNFGPYEKSEFFLVQTSEPIKTYRIASSEESKELSQVQESKQQPPSVTIDSVVDIAITPGRHVLPLPSPEGFEPLSQYCHLEFYSPRDKKTITVNSDECQFLKHPDQPLYGLNLAKIRGLELSNDFRLTGLNLSYGRIEERKNLFDIFKKSHSQIVFYASQIQNVIDTLTSWKAYSSAKTLEPYVRVGQMTPIQLAGVLSKTNFYSLGQKLLTEETSIDEFVEDDGCLYMQCTVATKVLKEVLRVAFKGNPLERRVHLKEITVLQSHRISNDSFFLTAPFHSQLALSVDNKLVEVLDATPSENKLPRHRANPKKSTKTEITKEEHLRLLSEFLKFSVEELKTDGSAPNRNLPHIRMNRMIRFTINLESSKDMSLDQLKFMISPSALHGKSRKEKLSLLLKELDAQMKRSEGLHKRLAHAPPQHIEDLAQKNGASVLANPYYLNRLQSAYESARSLIQKQLPQPDCQDLLSNP